MKAPTLPTTAPNSSKQSGITGCILTILAIVFAILGIYNLVFGSIIAYTFSSAQMFSPASIAIVFITVCTCFIYLFLAFHIKKQHWLVSLGLLAVVVLVFPLPLRLLINATTARVRIDGYSMGNTLTDGNYVLIDRYAYQQNDPQRGDVVIFQIPSSPNSDLLKRIIGLPGETVSINQGQTSINGTPINEPYISEKPTYNGEWEIPEGHYFVLGDNRNNSKDSHQWGTLPRENIFGKAVWIYFPFSNFGRIVDTNYIP